jgi:hypothetical protein
LTTNVKKLGFNFGISENIIANNTQYSNLLIEYKSQEIAEIKKENEILIFKENDFQNLKVNVPQFYENNKLENIVNSFKNYDNLISNFNYLNYLRNNLNNKDFNWTNPILSESSDDIQNNLTMRNFTLDEISKISEKLKYNTYIGYEVIFYLCSIFKI